MRKIMTLAILFAMLVVACGSASETANVPIGSPPATNGNATTPPATSLPDGATSVSSGPHSPAQNGAQASSDWVRFGFDPEHSGVNPHEQSIDASNVSRLHRLWITRLPGLADSVPVLLHGLRFPDGTVRDVLYLTTTQGQLLALDASNGKLIWKQETQGPSKLTKSSPVVDPETNTVYSYGLDGYLHKYDAITGRETRDSVWPVQITKIPRTEKESSALNIANGWIYVTTAGYLGDAPPYQGHIVAINEHSGRVNVFNSLCANIRHVLAKGECDADRSGIWARPGVVVDPATDSIYATTGNGPFDANQGGDNYGDSILKLSMDVTQLKDSYTPENYRELQDQDEDLSSAAPALLPRLEHSNTPLLLVQGGKDGKLRLVNRQNMNGEGRPGRVGGEVQTMDSAGCDTFTQPAVWTDKQGHVWVFVAGTCAFVAYKVVTDASGNTTLQLGWVLQEQTTSPVIAGGVIFAASNGHMLALDPATGNRLWSAQIGGIHWESPIVIDGKLYISDESNTISAYGL